MKAYLFRASLAQLADGVLPREEVGIAIASNAAELYQALDESRDPYECIFREINYPCLFSARLSREQAEPHDDPLLDSITSDGGEVDTVAGSLLMGANESSGWHYFVPGSARNKKIKTAAVNDLKQWQQERKSSCG